MVELFEVNYECFLFRYSLYSKVLMPLSFLSWDNSVLNTFLLIRILYFSFIYKYMRYLKCCSVFWSVTFERNVKMYVLYYCCKLYFVLLSQIDICSLSYYYNVVYVVAIIFHIPYKTDISIDKTTRRKS